MSPQKYAVCWHFKDGQGCTRHGSRCSFARSSEEATVWDFQKRQNLEHVQLIALVAQIQFPNLRVHARPVSVAERILSYFPGTFLQFCESCFYSSPQTLTPQGPTMAYCYGNKHPWKPILVLFQQGENGIILYSEIRPFPPLNITQFRYCWHAERGDPCKRGPYRCWFPHTSVEMAVWTAESQEGLNRSELLCLSQNQQANSSPAAVASHAQPKLYCKVCKLHFSSSESFLNHCASLDHQRMISEDITTEWKYRDPPENINQVLQLCDRPSTCVYGDRCTAAHSEGELLEWCLRHRTAVRKARAAEAEGLLSYQERLLTEYRNTLNEILIMSEVVPGVTVSCDKDLTIYGQKELVPLKWTFKIQSERPLVEVALLKQQPGATFTLGEISDEDAWTYSIGERFCTSGMSYDVPVSFKAVNPGLYEQWLVFDFDMRPVLLQKLKVRVGQHSSIQPAEAAESQMPTVQSLERWHQGNRRIIPCLNKSEAEVELLKEYKPPQINLQYSPGSESSISITRQNYRERMHSFLYTEELAQEEVVSRLSLRVIISLTDQLPKFQKTAPSGELFAAVPVSYVLTPDTPEGFILKREVRSALVALSSMAKRYNRVYEAVILPDVISQNRLYLQLSKSCCSELRLLNGTSCEMEVQFQLNRLQFCEMHKAVDLLPDVGMVLPDLKQCCVPEHHGEYPRLNAKQQAAMSFILGDSAGRRAVAPLLIYGPFGTGKTFTLATAVKELYCSLSRDRQSFRFPERSILDSHRVVITTTVTARHFHKLKLPNDYFSHILIDEASQMLECEALIPLGLAGPGTRVVLAGDHMQMGPKLFSVDEDQRSNHTLLNRLFHYYQAEENNPVALKSRIIFNENYRSTQEIVDFVSAHFYVGTRDAIKASGNVPPHPQCHPLRFHHVRGECRLDTATMSWYNLDEVACVVDVVQRLLKEWPEEWGQKDEKMVCVLSEGKQVLQIREKLRELKLGRITVENSQNVQGKQFRVIVMTTVHTRDSLCSSDTACLEFLNDARVLNTVMTRAQSQVVVVGDAAALCYFGRCSKIWKSYIEQCIRKSSAEPRHLTEDHVEQEVREISRFAKRVEDDGSDTESSTSEIPDIEDPILKELLDENKDVRVSVTAEGLLDIIHEDQCSEATEFYSQEKKSYRDCSAPDLQILLLTNPHVYKRCEIIMQRYDSGYAIDLDQPTLRININGRKNVGRSLPGDQVVVEILNGESFPPSGRVVGILKTEDSPEFVCTIDGHDPQVMTPINNCVSKIYTPFWKDKPNYVAVRNKEDERLRPERFVKINEESKRNNLFVVKVLKWRHGFRNPLGVVVKVLPKVTTLGGGLEVLEIEYKLSRAPPSSVQEELNKYRSLKATGEGRRDYRGYMTFTIDPMSSKDLDDAISVRDLGRLYEVGVHIADIASFVTKGSAIDKYAEQQGTTFYPPEEEPAHMFPKYLSTDYFSLLPGCNRHAISLMVVVDKSTDQILSRELTLSVICSNRKMSYEDAEEIIQRGCGRGQSCDTLEGCLAMACHFAEIHRRARMLADWCYKQPEEKVEMGNRRSHRMVEELMIMFNHAVADWLITTETTKSLTPVRCQDEPDPEQMSQLKDKYDSLIPLSIHLSYHLDGSGCLDRIQEITGSGSQKRLMALDKTDQRNRVCENSVIPVSDTFGVLTSFLRNLESAAQSKDIYRMMDLITTDDIHPQLLPVVTELRKLMQKADFLRSDSSTKSRLGHHDLQLDSYTWASSPIRRYVDIIVQRMLHSVLENTEVGYKKREIDMLCADFSKKYARQSDYDKKAKSLLLASKLSQQSSGKVAFVVNVSPTGKNFYVAFPLNRDSLPNSLPIMYRDLQLMDQPEYNEDSHCMTLKWMRRVYSLTNNKIHSELKQPQPDQRVTSVLISTWKDVLSALRAEDWENVQRSVQKITSSITKKGSNRPESDGGWQVVSRNSSKNNEVDSEHYFELSLNLKVGETLQVQLGTDTRRGLLIPVVQLVNIHPKFEICLEHVKNPTACFSKYALRASKSRYTNYMEYQKIWKPLCEMESASNAVAENDSIVLEDVQVVWKSSPKEKMPKGVFRLPLEKKKKWSIECDLLNCFLCIRTRGVNQSIRGDQAPSDLADTGSFVWVAHGLTTRVTDEEESKRLSYVQIDFRINQLSMETIPVFRKDVLFTVELIPKLLPDVRKEDTIDNLRQANQLVKNIALGNNTSPTPAHAGPVRKKHNIEIKIPASVKLPPLNKSQREAISKALESPFTLIQGPPGTGKTVVGVHIVYSFFKRNQEREMTTITRKRQNNDGETPRKQCVLYCGPSNKSVDVVAEHLLRFKDELKPLRVYSEQMEMLEFPYPGSQLKLSRKTVREEKPNEELRYITLHHRIRMDGNPFATQIRYFDMRIQRGEDLPDEEVESYKKLLNKARQHELLNHDVVLCTCTAASNPNFTKTLNLQQILIDECAMATEPEAFIPLVSHKPEQIVLLGDHKQLQPIVHCDLVKRLGMRTSLFERYMEKALMLDTQYRMHESICEFPSKEFYKGRLETAVTPKPSVLQTKSKHSTPIIFGHVEGKEVSLVVSTERGNENSRANLEEAEQAVRIASLLTSLAQVDPGDIAILTPYNAQVSKINETLSDRKIQNITVSTIMKSQGSEWRYVILSTVRSCPRSEIDTEPTKAWLTKRLGFVMDPNQVNVGITRAQEGLCIIGKV
ncbi:hypothetical protein MATL_G00079860 [Megalops atlanticus]|uniref:Uncharacterized protein n=1 Tax=Megalops atlanticus TaxID=7932 RepID=A0A9D3QAC7_MEGAT|nr:hypothetical protein MATL_G00079860 [Megalops atlanticus]